MKIIKNQKTIESTIKMLEIEHILRKDVHHLLSIFKYDSNEQIIADDTSVDYLMLLFEGQAQIMPSSKEGRLVSMGFITPLDIIGDLEYFSKDPYYHNVYAVNPCNILALPTEYIESHFNKNTEFYKYLLENMANKMKKTSMLFSRSLLYPVKMRVAMYIYDMISFNKSNELFLNYKQTAELMGITPRHFRRLLSEFEEEGIIIRKRTSIEVLDKVLLKKYT